MRATIIGAVDRRILELLTASGITADTVPAADSPALAQVGALPPDVLVLDARGQERVPAALAILKRLHPKTPIVLVASHLDPTFILEAMRSGASECLVEPLTQVEVQAAVNRVSDQMTPAATGQIFAFLGAKGGVGTTTAAVNVATELARVARGATLMIDLHLTYGDAAVFLGTDARFSVIDAIENSYRLDEAIFRGLVVRTKSGLDLLASSDRAMTAPIDVTKVGQVIDVASRHYRYLVLDVPRSEPAVLESLAAVKTIVVVANQELATVKSAGRIAAMLRQRYGKERVRVVVSRHDPRADIDEGDIQRAVGGPVEHLFPNDYRVAVEAMNTGVPIVLGNHSRLSASYVAFARQLAGLDPTDADQRGLFGRLTGRRRS
jgi:pilus assembly protein CpaE